MTRRFLSVVMITVATWFVAAGARAESALFGPWRFDKTESTDIAGWGRRTPHLDIRDDGETVTIVTDWRRGARSWCDTLTVVPGGTPATSVVRSRIWPQNWFMGVLAKVGSTRTASATWLEPGRRLETRIEQVVEVSQGEATIVTTSEFSLDPDGDRLTVIERRSTRPSPVTLIFDRVTAENGE